MIQNISYKDFFKRYGIFVAILAVIFGILIYTILMSQRAWTQNLKTTVELVLDEKEPNSWTVENNIKIKNPFSLNAACYEVRNRKTGDLYKAVIIKAQSLYGPVPGVFTIDKDNNVEFVGFSSLHGAIASQLINNENSKRMEFWMSKIPDILNN